MLSFEVDMHNTLEILLAQSTKEGGLKELTHTSFPSFRHRVLLKSSYTWRKGTQLTNGEVSKVRYKMKFPGVVECTVAFSDGWSQVLNCENEDLKCFGKEEELHEKLKSICAALAGTIAARTGYFVRYGLVKDNREHILSITFGLSKVDENLYLIGRSVGLGRRCLRPFMEVPLRIWHWNELKPFPPPAQVRPATQLKNGFRRWLVKEFDDLSLFLALEKALEKTFPDLVEEAKQITLSAREGWLKALKKKLKQANDEFILYREKIYRARKKYNRGVCK
jgi:hypothetical protein